MTEAIGPGSLVECVDVSRHVIRSGVCTKHERGKIYRVIGFGPPNIVCPKCGPVRTILTGVAGEKNGKCITRFRPIGGDAQSIDEMIKLAKKTKEPACTQRD